jgi:hypothetical protein
MYQDIGDITPVTKRRQIQVFEVGSHAAAGSAASTNVGSKNADTSVS